MEESPAAMRWIVATQSQHHVWRPVVNIRLKRVLQDEKRQKATVVFPSLLHSESSLLPRDRGAR